MKKTDMRKIITAVCCLAAGVALGVVIGIALIGVLDTDVSLGEYLLTLAVFLVTVYIAYFLQTIMHEAGHLIFGLMTGYRFASFRVGSIILTRENGKFRFGRYSLAGTGGQCLLAPPEEKDGKIPYALYNAGGVIMNVILGIAGLTLYFVLHDENLFGAWLFAFALIGFLSAMINGIPMQIGLVNNDGYNILSLGRDAHAQRAFLAQLKINELMTDGVRLRDMPEELFRIPEDADMSNPINNAISVFACNRLVDRHEFEEAKQAIDAVLKNRSVMGIYKNMLVCDLAFCRLVTGETEAAAMLLSEPQKKFMEMMKNNPSIIRTWYAYYLIYAKDVAKSAESKNKFAKTVSAYPYRGEAESETELIKIAEGL